MVAKEYKNTYAERVAINEKDADFRNSIWFCRLTNSKHQTVYTLLKTIQFKAQNPYHAARDKQAAVLMASHDRLGHVSPMRVLSSDICKIICMWVFTDRQLM